MKTIHKQSVAQGVPFDLLPVGTSFRSVGDFEKWVRFKTDEGYTYLGTGRHFTLPSGTMRNNSMVVEVVPVAVENGVIIFTDKE